MWTEPFMKQKSKYFFAHGEKDNFDMTTKTRGTCNYPEHKDIEVFKQYSYRRLQAGSVINMGLNSQHKLKLPSTVKGAGTLHFHYQKKKGGVSLSKRQLR